MSSVIDLSISQEFINNDKLLRLITIKNILKNIVAKRLFLLLDTSGSMAGQRLNLVLHACKAIISSSNENIEISIFTFNSVCDMRENLMVMTPLNKTQFMDTISTIRATGTTDLILGLNTILEYIKSIPNDNFIDTHCLVFTDGEPNDKNIDIYNILFDTFYLDKTFNCTIDVFGFGNSLSIDILKIIYTRGKGIFSYISDLNMMATIFNNYLANLITTSITNITLSYEIEDSNGKVIYEHLPIGSIISDQERNIIIEYSIDSKIGYTTLSYCNLDSSKNESHQYEEIPLVTINKSKFYLNKLRNDLIMILNISEYIIKSINDLYKKYQIILSELSENSYTEGIRILLDDIKSTDPNKGQIEKAIINYDKWGKYYLISIYGAHSSQTKINFKDESIQNYSGSIANEYLIRLDTIFNSIEFISYYGQMSTTFTSQATISASSFNNRSAGCFDEKCRVKIIVNNVIQLIQLKDLKQGDILYNEYSTIIVEYIIKTKYSGQQLYKQGELIGTGNHPIYDNEWILFKDSLHANPIEYYDCEWLITISAIEIKNNNIYNIESFCVENINCATFGHGYLNSEPYETNYSVLSSTFWGKSILDIMKRLSNNQIIIDNTLILDNNYSFIKDINGWTIGLNLDGISYY
jgi:uncharacterized protein YegL